MLLAQLITLRLMLLHCNLHSSSIPAAQHNQNASQCAHAIVLQVTPYYGLSETSGCT
jgi:hypothetical protein